MDGNWDRDGVEMEIKWGGYIVRVINVSLVSKCVGGVVGDGCGWQMGSRWGLDGEERDLKG